MGGQHGRPGGRRAPQALLRAAQVAQRLGRLNKVRVERLTHEGRMAPAGLAAIERAKANGCWEILDAVERLEVPEDLMAALEALPPAAADFAAFTPSARKMLLGWIALARRPETRSARIAKVAEAAARHERARG